MKLNLKDYIVKEKKEKEHCEVCHKEFDELSSIRITSYDSYRRYKGSGRPIITNYKIKACPKCFKKIMKKIEEIIL